MATIRHGMAQTDQRYAVASRTVSPSTSKGLAAIDTAARDGKYLFIFFWKANDEQSRTMYGVFQSAMNKWAESANSIGIQGDRSQREADCRQARRQPCPHAAGRGLGSQRGHHQRFPDQVHREQLREGFVSPCTAKCMKALQDRKLVSALCPEPEDAVQSGGIARRPRVSRQMPDLPRRLRSSRSTPATKRKLRSCRTCRLILAHRRR